MVRSRAIPTLCLAIFLVSCAAPMPVEKPEDKQRIDDLISLLRDDRPEIRLQAANLAFQMGPQAFRAIPALIENIGPGHKHQLLNVAATNALLRMGASLAVPPLIQAVENPNSEIAYGAAFTLGGFGRSAITAAPTLKKALANPQVRPAAELALKMIAEG